MTLTAIHNGSADNSNCGVGVLTSRTRNGLACASVTADEPRERGNRFVPNLWIPIRRQNLDEISYHVGNADIFVTARLAGEAVKSTFADRRHGIVQSAAKGVRRNVNTVPPGGFWPGCVTGTLGRALGPVRGQGLQG